jgi:hypothetical protein
LVLTVASKRDDPRFLKVGGLIARFDYNKMA